MHDARKPNRGASWRNFSSPAQCQRDAGRSSYFEFELDGEETTPHYPLAMTCRCQAWSRLRPCALGTASLPHVFVATDDVGERALARDDSASLRCFRQRGSVAARGARHERTQQHPEQRGLRRTTLPARRQAANVGRRLRTRAAQRGEPQRVVPAWARPPLRDRAMRRMNHRGVLEHHDDVQRRERVMRACQRVHGGFPFEDSPKGRTTMCQLLVSYSRAPRQRPANPALGVADRREGTPT